jgi:uncharacterized MAPEG superfamily protein
VTVELWILFAVSVLGIVHLTVASFAFKLQVGNKYTVGSRDENLQPTGVAGRLRRAHHNYLETFAIFAVFVLLVHLTQANGPWSHWGCILYLVGRVLFLPLYAWGVPWLRTFSWNLATLGLVLVGLQVVIATLDA